MCACVCAELEKLLYESKIVLAFTKSNVKGTYKSNFEFRYITITFKSNNT